jgi:hypothetical protein
MYDLNSHRHRHRLRGVVNRINVVIIAVAETASKMPAMTGDVYGIQQQVAAVTDLCLANGRYRL